MYTMGDIAEKSLQDEEWFYKAFGIDGEIIIDHAWGIEPVTMADIKSYHTCSHSLSKGQVLPRPYCYSETRIVMTEMIDDLCYDMFGKNLLAPIYTWWVAYDPKSLTREGMPVYRGSISADYMGRAVPKHSNGSVRFPVPTNSFHTVSRRILKSFDEKVGQDLLFRRLGISAYSLVNAISADKVTSGRDVRMNLLGDYDSDRFKAMEDMNRIATELERENNIQQAMLDVRKNTAHIP